MVADKLLFFLYMKPDSEKETIEYNNEPNDDIESSTRTTSTTMTRIGHMRIPHANTRISPEAEDFPVLEDNVYIVNQLRNIVFDVGMTTLIIILITCNIVTLINKNYLYSTIITSAIILNLYIFKCMR